jgi:hypothetical protein
MKKKIVIPSLIPIDYIPFEPWPSLGYDEFYVSDLEEAFNYFVGKYSPVPIYNHIEGIKNASRIQVKELSDKSEPTS